MRMTREKRTTGECRRLRQAPGSPLSCRRLVPVPLFDTATPLAPLRERIHAKLAEIADGGRYILGPEVEAFETEFASCLGARHAIGVANGTDALTIALRTMGVGRATTWSSHRSRST